MRLAWNGFALDLPPDWEVTAYLLDGDQGEFRLNRRLEPRAQLTWKRHRKAAPDIGRVLRDLHVRMCEQRLFGPEEPLVRERAGWSVARGRAEIPRHAARWFAARQLLVHLVVDPMADDAEFDALLDSWQTRSDQRVEYAIFGVRAVLPEKFTIEHLVARPGNVRLIASGPRMTTLTVRCIGMARHFVHGLTLTDFYSRLLRAEGSGVLASESRTLRDLPGAQVTFRRAGEHAMEKVLGAFWKGTGLLWHDAAANRLFALEQIGPARAPRLELDDVVPR